MGCDIHLYVEYQTPGYDVENDHWRDFGGRINPGRNYFIFSRMAGVRGGPALVERRGFPDNAGYEASGDYWMYIDHDGDASEEGETTAERAAYYVEKCGCRYRGEYQVWKRTTTDTTGAKTTSLIGAQHDGKPTHVSHPDWHSHSWLTTEEFAAALSEGCPIEYSGVLGAMRAMEANGAVNVRVVFWFDN